MTKESAQNVRLLFLSSGLAMPNMNLAFKDKFEFFSEHYSGYILTHGISESKNILSIGRFRYYPIHYYENALIRNILFLGKVICRAYKLFLQNNKFDVIISTDPLITGIAAVLIGRLTKAKVIIEVNGNFESAFKFGAMGEADPGIGERIKDKVSRSIISHVLAHADVVKLVYRNQLDNLNIKKHIKTVSFPNFVPINHFIEGEKVDGKYILLLGYPWYLKGVDILIKAFKKISHEFPEYRLKVVGWCPEGRDFFEDLARDNDRIELCDPVNYEKVISLMTYCSLYVLASRTDSSPRVLREAMASRKPIVAADIDGVPDLIKDGFNGLLFKKEDPNDLADKMRLVLSNKRLADTLGENGLQYVQEHLSERCYLNNYQKMINKTINA